MVAGLELAHRHLAAELARGESLRDPAAAGRYFKQRLRARPNEVFAALFLDNQHRTLACEELFSGTVDAAAVYPREVVRDALLRNSCALVLVHNHPSGAARPSRADEVLTQTLKQAAALVDVRVLDHFIVAGDSVNSMAELGMV